MATIIEVKYFNSFLLKRQKSDSGNPGIRGGVIWNGSFGIPQPLGGFDTVLERGQQSTDPQQGWYIEESRIRAGYNNTSTDYGVRAYIVEDNPKQSTRFNSMIYSGIFNSRTDINQTNVFSVADDITKSVDPANGSIQKLYAEDTNLIIFQESKVSKALIDKDAIYSAEGGGTVTSSNLVIGAIQPFGGQYGIGLHPESFAVYGYNKYFVDSYKNTVMRLGADGLSEISSHGMKAFFRNEISEIDSPVFGKGEAQGGWDIHSKEYVLSLKKSSDTTQFKTLAFDEGPKGWTSFYSYKPDQVFSVRNNYYTSFNGKIFKHHDSSANYNDCYGS